MSALPTRLSTAASLAAFGALGGALAGGAEAARVVVATALAIDDLWVVLLGVAGAAAGALVGAGAASVAVAFPTRPSGRSRWLGFLLGGAAWGLLDLAVWWFTDPPPFVDPAMFQGNVLVFGVVCAGVAAVVLALYQGVRGANAVVGASAAIAVCLGLGVYGSARRPAPAAQSAPSGAPNVLVVTLDTVRADRFGAYGADELDTRHFDGLAAQGALFERAMAVAPVTGPSHASMFLGAGPWDHGVLLNGVPIPDDRPTLAEILRAHGWATGGFVSAYVLDGALGFRRGFGTYDDDFGALPGWSALLPARAIAMARRAADPDTVLERRGGDTTDAALRWLARQDGRWFLWVHLFDAHGPYAPPPPWDTRYYAGDRSDPANTSMRDVTGVAPYLARSLAGITDLDWVLAQYAGEVGYADTQLGRLLDAVEARGDRDRTVVAVIGDHGESLGEHGVWFNHGDDVQEASVHVPFALTWPGKVPRGVRVAAPFEGSDLAPTLLTLVGVAPPETMTGRSAVAQLQVPGGRTAARSVCFDRDGNRAERAAGRLTKPRWRMAGLRTVGGRYVSWELDQREAWFDLDADPSGTHDALATAAPSDLAALRAQAGAIFESAATARSGDAALSDEARARLEALGYLDPVGD